MLICLMVSCAEIGKVRLVPKYEGVDPQLAPYADEWMNLAKDNGITFKNKVTIGFEKINRGYVVGQCWYGGFWREIDIDFGYWTNLDQNEKDSLLWHELSHCYCGRSHDYGKDKPYGDDVEKAYGVADGFMVDGCPKSLMFPEVVNSFCFQLHSDYYEKEMFEGCKPW